MVEPKIEIYRSITKKQIVALTGLLLILFVIVHLAGNLLIYAGPENFNAYSERLNQLGLLKYAFEWGLFLLFMTHIVFTAWVVHENLKARGHNRYAIDGSKGPRSLATRLMPYSGTYLIIYLIYHIYDFAWANKLGLRSVIHGKSYGIYGLVVNSFKDPIHSFLYIVAMCFLALHLAHGTKSFIQTFGLSGSPFSPKVRRISLYFGWGIMLAYSSIPLYVLYLLKI